MRATFVLILARGEWGEAGKVYLGQCPDSVFGIPPGVSRLATWRDVGLVFDGERRRVCRLQGTACNIRTDSGKEWVMVDVGGRHGGF